MEDYWFKYSIGGLKEAEGIQEITREPAESPVEKFPSSQNNLSGVTTFIHSFLALHTVHSSKCSNQESKRNDSLGEL